MYGIGFDRKWFFSLSNGLFKNVIIFGVDMSSSPHIDNKKNILILGKGATQGLEDTATTKKCIQLVLLKLMKIFVWACIITDEIANCLSMVQTLLNLKQRNLRF